MVRDRQKLFSQDWDGWLEALVAAMETTSDAASSVAGRCAPVKCPALRQAVLAHLSRPAGTSRISLFDFPGSINPPDISSLPAVYSPAICSLGRLPRSTPRSLASSRPM